MLVKELAKTFGRFGIRVNALAPGAIAAGGFVADPALAKHIPLGRLGRSEDLAPMALAVLSNRVSAYVTGAAIVVDGGLSLTTGLSLPILVTCGSPEPRLRGETPEREDTSCLAMISALFEQHMEPP